MSSVQPDRSYSRHYTIIHCPCGRDLRVKRALAGTEVRCWDCHKMVLVPVPPTTGLIARAVGLGFVDAFQKEVIAATGVAAVLVTVLMYASGTGAPYAAAAAMIALAVGYGELIRQSDQPAPKPTPPEGEEETEDEPEPIRYGWLAFRGIAAAAVGLILSAPWLLTPRDLEHVPRFSRRAEILGAAGCVVLPLLMLLAYGQDRSEPLGLRRFGRAVVRHPIILLASLLLFPLGVVLAELMTLAFTTFIGWMQFLILEVYPRSEDLCNALGIPWTVDNYIGGIPDRRYFQFYGIRLNQGYTLLGAVPHTLAIPRFSMLFPWGFPVLTHAYLFLRLGLTVVMFWIIFSLLALQARWLGVIATVDSRVAAEV